MKTTEISIDLNKAPNVLMTGNGFNRLFNFASWEVMLKSIQTKSLTDEEKDCLKHIPYPLRPVILTEDHIDRQIDELANKLTNLQIPDEEREIIRKFTSIPFDAILTTNYTYEIEKAIDPEFNCQVGHKYIKRKFAYEAPSYNETNQLHTYFEGSNKNQSIWHVHGEASNPDTMIIDHYFYGMLLSKMQSYASSFYERYCEATKQGTTISCHSWIDYFLLGNVYIVGQGMNVSEFDLWWLVNCKKKNYPNTKIFLYNTSISIEQKLLAETYGIEIVPNKIKGKKDYVKYYNDVAEELKRIL